MTKIKFGKSATALAIVYLVWGSTFYGIHLGLVGGLPPLLLIGSRFLLAGIALYSLARVMGESGAGRFEWKEGFHLAGLLLVLGPGLVAVSEQWISSGLAALLTATSPLWVVLLDRSQPITLQKSLGLTLGLAGVAWLVGSSISLEGEKPLFGGLLCLLSAWAWALGSLRSRGRSRGRSNAHSSGVQMLCAGLALCTLGLALGERVELLAVTPQAWWALVYLSVFGSMLAFSAYNWLVRNLSAPVVASHAYVNPVVAVAIGCLFGGESLSTGAGLGALLALGGVVLLMIPPLRLPFARPRAAWPG